MNEELHRGVNRPVASRTRSAATAVLVIAVSVSIAAGFSVMELAVRVLRLAPPREAFSDYVDDSLTGYRPRPLSTTTVRTPEFSYTRKHNSAGFRDVERAFVKPPGAFRVLVLGDSFTYGAGVEFEQTFPHLLEQMLNARGGHHPRIEVLNAGVPGFFPEPERALLERYGMQYAPDLVLVVFVPNDVIDTYRGMGALAADGSGNLLTREARQLGPRLRSIITHSDLARLLVAQYIQRRLEEAFGASAEDVYVANGSYEREWLTIEAEYGRMAALAAREHARFGVVCVPQRGRWRDRDTYPARRLSAWSTAHRAIAMDVAPDMSAAAGQSTLYYPVDGHCTPEGHVVIATALFKALQRFDAVP